MKRFIFSILFVSVFFIGLGALVDKTTAKFKSDEKALALIRDARRAIGGDSAIANVRSMTIIGQTTRTLKIDGADRVEQGETEISMQLPNKLMKMVKIGQGNGPGEDSAMKEIDVVVVGGNKDGKKFVFKGADGETVSGDGAKTIIVKKGDGTIEELKGGEAHKVIVRTANGDKSTVSANDEKTITSDGKHVMINRVGGDDHHGAMRHNEMLRLTLSLLLTAPDGMDVNYTYGGETDVDGTACNIVVAGFAGSAFKLYLGKSSNLPVMMSYAGHKMPQIMTFHHDGAKAGADTKDTTVFTRKIDGPSMETAEFNVKFSDYRSTGGVQLPYKWTQTVGGVADETFDVTSYEINPANIADRFNNQNVKVRVMKKPDGQ